MSAEKYNLEIEQGVDLDLSVSLTNSDDTPIDITGCTFAGKIRKNHSDPTILANLSIAIVGAGTNGTINIGLSAAQTAGLPVDKATGPNRNLTYYAYDIEMTKPDTKVSRILEGMAVISPEVTR